MVMSLVQFARLNGHELWAYLRDVLEQLLEYPNQRIDELLPHRWTPASARRSLTNDQLAAAVGSVVDCTTVEFALMCAAQLFSAHEKTPHRGDLGRDFELLGFELA